MSKHILVTGGFGFIGSWLVDKLLEQGHRVTVVDDLRSNAVDDEHYARYFENGQLSWFCMSVEAFAKMAADTNPAIDGTTWAGLDVTTPDEIYHLASPVGPVGVIAHAGEIVRQIADSTYAVVELARRHGAKLVDVSTSEVYGGGQLGLCAEEMPRIIQAETTVRLEYAVAKLAMETALINTTKVSDLQAVIVRPFNVAGPRQKADGGFVLPRFVGQALRGEPLTIYGDGQQVRAFTHVADIVDGLMLAMEKGASGEVYNLGNPANRTTINRLARDVITLVGGETVSYIDPKTIHGALFAEAADKFPDASKSMHELGWKPQHDLSRIVADVRDSMQSTLQAAPKTSSLH